MKLITFGCSFTDYSWPTWSDIIALDLDCEYENWAIGGGGNQQIARRILYRDQDFGWQDTDVVMVQWTSITREDRFYSTRWVSQGSVSMAPHYGPAWVEKYWSWNNDVINTAQARITSERILGHRLKYQMAMTWGDGDHLLEKDDRITKFWRSRLTPCDEVPSHAKPFDGKTADGHPDPDYWLRWVETKIYPRLGREIKPSTRAKVKEMQMYLEDLVRKKTPQNLFQQMAAQRTLETDWPVTTKCKPDSHTLGSNGHQCRILI